MGLGERPATARALSDGLLSAGHAEVIVRAARTLPAGLSAARRATVEADLVAKAQLLPPHALRRAVRRAIAASYRPDRVSWRSLLVGKPAGR